MYEWDERKANKREREYYDQISQTTSYLTH
jgi:hypothetical protein